MESITLSEATHAVAVSKASHVLASGGIVLYPTDTLYGLAVDATNSSAVEKLRALKDRDEKNKFSICVADINMLEHYAHMTPLGRSLAEQHLPGALTLVVPMKVPLTTNTSKDGTLAIRIPHYAFCQDLARAFEKPYTATSANVSGLETKTTITDILEQFGTSASLIDLAVDAGPLLPNPGSTVVDACGEVPKILRQGSLRITE